MDILRLRIVQIDHDSYCGRDHHPSDTDLGLIVTVIGMETFHCDPDSGEMDAALDGGQAAYPERVIDAKDDMVQMFVCVTPDYRTLDLVTDEVEVVQ